MANIFYKRILGKAAKKLIEDAVDMLFNRAKQRLIGPQSLDHRIYFTSDPISLPGLYRTASDSEKNIPDYDLLESLMEIANGYIEKSRQTTKMKVVNTIESFLREAHTKNIKTDVETVLQGQLANIWQTTTSDMKRIVDTEATNVRNVATLDGVIKINAASGIEDPVVGFVVSRDQYLCSSCKDIHTINGSAPKLWYLSELGHGYHHKGETNPKVGGLHPNCMTSSQKLLTKNGWISFEKLYGSKDPIAVIVDGRIKNELDSSGQAIPTKTYFDSTLDTVRMETSSPVIDTGIQECLRFEFIGTKHYPVWTTLEVSTGHEMWIIDKQEKGKKIRADEMKVGDRVPSLFYDIVTKKQFIEDPYLIINKIESIGKQQTYCVEEPMTNTITVNGVVTGNCRCTLVTMMPGYTFDANGNVTYKEPGWSEIKHQRGEKQ